MELGLMRNANPKLRLKKGLLLSGDEFYYSPRPTTDARKLSLVSKTAKSKAPKPKVKTATQMPLPAVPRTLREKAKSSQERAAREKKG